MHNVMTTLCEVCNELTSKYKCSTCYSPYCSLGCWKRHKNENNCRIQSPVDRDSQTQNNSDKQKYFTEDTISAERLSQLGESEKLKKILQNRYLQNTLVSLDNASNPEEAVRQAMMDPEFVEFVDECLKIVEDSND